MGTKFVYDPDLDWTADDSFDDAPEPEPDAGPGDDEGQLVQDDEVTA